MLGTNLLNAAFHVLPYSVVVLDRQGDIILFNKAWERFGIENTPDRKCPAQIGTNYFDVCRQADKEGEKILEGIQKVIDGSIDVFTFEYPCHSLEVQRWFLLHAARMPAEHGGAVISHPDITIRKLGEQKQKDLALILSKAITDAKAANRAKSTFLSHMSHEIRTPLNAILGYAQILQMNGSLSSKQEEAVNTIETSGNHLLELINRILDIAKIEAGQNELKLTDFNLTSLIEGLAVMFRERCESKGLEFCLDGLTPEPIYVHGDEGKLRQILVNLLGNAVKFTEQGKVSLKIEMAKDNKYIFKVKDTGSGISTEAKAKIFEAFKQAEAGFHYGGTGLGLTISKELMESMGGEISVESKIGEGSCFSISLELAPARKTVPPRTNRNRRVIGLSENHFVKILIVDDDEDNRKLLSEALRTIGIETLEVENGKEALKRLEEFEPHIILMDRQMPVMNGEEAIKEIVKKYGPDRFKIVAVTAAAFEHEQEKIKLLGFDDYIMKPFRVSHVHSCIEKLLDVEFEYEDERQ